MGRTPLDDWLDSATSGHSSFLAMLRKPDVQIVERKHAEMRGMSAESDTHGCGVITSVFPSCTAEPRVATATLIICRCCVGRGRCVALCLARGWCATRLHLLRGEVLPVGHRIFGMSRCTFVESDSR